MAFRICCAVLLAGALAACSESTAELRTAAPDRVVTGARAYKDVGDCLALKLQELGESYGGGANSFYDDAHAKVVIIMKNTSENVVYAEVAAVEGQTVVQLKDGIRYTVVKKYLDRAEFAAKACMAAS